GTLRREGRRGRARVARTGRRARGRGPQLRGIRASCAHAFLRGAGALDRRVRRSGRGRVSVRGTLRAQRRGRGARRDGPGGPRHASRRRRLEGPLAHADARGVAAMRAMVLIEPRRPLELRELPDPDPQPGQVLLRVRACGVCRTDLHIADGELASPKLPLVLGHQIVATAVGDERRIGIPWLGWTDGDCRYCRSGRENLCDKARFTGYDADGGYAEYAVADERFCLGLPDEYGDLEVAPLLCAGLIGYRALRLAGDGERLGLYGFGASAHIV